MKDRCDNPNSAAYVNYGGRGIGYDPSWSNFKNFLADVGFPPAPRSELDRIDNAKGYTKTNCRWVSHTENNRNKRTNRMFNVLGGRYTLSEIAEKVSIPYRCLRSRLSRGESIETAISRPSDMRFSHRRRNRKNTSER